MLKKIGIKKLLIILISSIVVVGAAVTSVIIITRNNTAQHNNENSNSDNINPLEPINNGVRLMLSSDKKTEYYLGDEFIAPVVFGEFEKNKLVEVTNSGKITISGYDMEQVGIQVINVEYIDENIYGRVSYIIYVKNAKLVSISAEYEDSEILWGQMLDKKKLSVFLNYSNNDKIQIFDYKLEYISMPENYGSNEAKITYGNLSTTFTINVVEKSIDSKFEFLDNEMKRLLTIIGYKNPTCPKDYSFSQNSYGEPIFKSPGIFDNFNGQSESTLIEYVKNTIFSGYTFVEGPVSTSELIFLSDRYVFEHPSKDILVKFYLFKNQPDYKYNITLLKK